MPDNFLVNTNIWIQGGYNKGNKQKHTKIIASKISYWEWEILKISLPVLSIFFSTSIVYLELVNELTLLVRRVVCSGQLTCHEQRKTLTQTDT